MSTLLGDARVRLRPDTAGFEKEARGSLLGATKKIAGAMAGVFAAVGVGNFFKDSITEASDLGESINALNVTYGDAAAGIQQLGAEAAKSLGLSNVEFNSLSVRFSAFAKTIAGPGGDVVGLIEDLTTRAADFASVMNLDVSEAAQLFQSGLAGESEPLRAYGIDVSAATVETFAYANGIAAAGEKLTAAQKVTATYGSIMAQTAQVTGDFANTSNSLANAQRISAAGWENLKAVVGTAFLPVQEKVTNAFANKLLPALTTFATEKAPLVAEWSEKMATGIGALYELLVNGDYTGGLNDAFGWAEDSTVVDVLFRIRDALIEAGTWVKQFFTDLSNGDTSAMKDSLGSIWDSLQRLAPAAQEFLDQLPSMAQVTDVVATALDFLADNVDTIIALMPLLVAGFVLYRAAALASIAVTIANLPIRFAEIAAMAMQGRGNAALAFQLSVLTGVQQRSTAATIASSIATKAKAVVTGISSAATALYTGVTQRATIMAQLNALATYGQSTAFGTLTAAQKVAVVWNKLVTGAQWLWNAALSANPIGIVVVAIAAFVGALILAYNKSDTFRAIVDKTWAAIKIGATVLWEQVLKPFFEWLINTVINTWTKFQELKTILGLVWDAIKAKASEAIRNVVDTFLGMVESIVTGAAEAFGWVPGLGPKLETAAEDFRRFRDNVNAALGGINDKTVNVRTAVSQSFRSGVDVALASGGPVIGPGTGTSDSILAALSNGEHVWTAKEVKAIGGHDAMLRLRASAVKRAAGGPIGYVGGGRSSIGSAAAAPLIGGDFIWQTRGDSDKADLDDVLFALRRIRRGGTHARAR